MNINLSIIKKNNSNFQYFCNLRKYLIYKRLQTIEKENKYEMEK